MKILAIESSCDETAAAVVENGTKIISNVVASSKDIQEKWGGIVPEVAAREQVKSIIPVIIEALRPFTKSTDLAYKPIIEKNIDAIAVTIGPGLIGSLLIGVEAARTLAWTCNKPVIPVNHVLAHMYANFVFDIEIIFPAISLVVSGGHTELYLMTSYKDLKWLGGTIDDAAGECFDKTARLLGFGGRGGLAIQEAASLANGEWRMVNRNNKNNPSAINHKPYAITLPRPLLHDKTLNFSFSGLKTAVQREWNKLNTNHSTIQPFDHDLVNIFAYEIQESITDVLVKKTMRAAQMHNAKSIMISGGVAANTLLREKFHSQLTTYNLQLIAPPVQLCTDNAVSIASYAYFYGEKVSWEKFVAQPNLTVEL